MTLNIKDLSVRVRYVGTKFVLRLVTDLEMIHLKIVLITSAKADAINLHTQNSPYLLPKFRSLMGTKLLDFHSRRQNFISGKLLWSHVKIQASFGHERFRISSSASDA